MSHEQVIHEQLGLAW